MLTQCHREEASNRGSHTLRAHLSGEDLGAINEGDGVDTGRVKGDPEEQGDDAHSVPDLAVSARVGGEEAGEAGEHRYETTLSFRQR